MPSKTETSHCRRSVIRTGLRNNGETNWSISRFHTPVDISTFVSLMEISRGTPRRKLTKEKLAAQSSAPVCLTMCILVHSRRPRIPVPMIKNMITTPITVGDLSSAICSGVSCGRSIFRSRVFGTSLPRMRSSASLVRYRHGFDLGSGRESAGARRGGVGGIVGSLRFITSLPAQRSAHRGCLGNRYWQRTDKVAVLMGWREAEQSSCCCERLHRLGRMQRWIGRSGGGKKEEGLQSDKTKRLRSARRLGSCEGNRVQHVGLFAASGRVADKPAGHRRWSSSPRTSGSGSSPLQP